VFVLTTQDRGDREMSRVIFGECSRGSRRGADEPRV